MNKVLKFLSNNQIFITTVADRDAANMQEMVVQKLSESITISMHLMKCIPGLDASVVH